MIRDRQMLLLKPPRVKDIVRARLEGIEIRQLIREESRRRSRQRRETAKARVPGPQQLRFPE
jgi:hypothetical protein